LQGSEQLTGPDELLPAGEHLAAQQCAVAYPVLHCGQRVAVRRAYPIVQDRTGPDLVVDRGGQPGDQGPDGRDRAREGLTDHRGPRVGVPGEPGQPVAQRLGRLLGQESLAVDRDLRDDEQHRPAEAMGGEHLGEVSGDLVGALLRNAIEHERDDCAALEGGASAAASSWVASARLASTTESMSGASSSARPGRRAGADTICNVLGVLARPVVRARPGSRFGRLNHGASDGWQTRTGARVVGRSTPAALTGALTRLFTKVDLPAPVDPPTTASSGASSLVSRGSR
jgi:hypothetical protein